MIYFNFEIKIYFDKNKIKIASKLTNGFNINV